MKSRVALLTFVSLLLASSLAYTATASPASVPTVPAALAQTSTPAEAPSCAQAGPAISLFAPAPQNETGDMYCGMCGKDPCRGVLRGTTCGYDFNTGTVKRCEMTTGSLCPVENRVICYCYGGPIP